MQAERVKFVFLFPKKLFLSVFEFNKENRF